MSPTFAQVTALRELPSLGQGVQIEFWGTHRVENWAGSPERDKRE